MKQIILSLALASSFVYLKADIEHDKAQFDAIAQEAYMENFINAQQRCSIAHNTADCAYAFDKMNRVILFYLESLKGTREPGTFVPAYAGKPVKADTHVELQTRMAALSVNAAKSFAKK